MSYTDESRRHQPTTKGSEVIFRRLDKRTIVFLADDHETEIGLVVLPEGGVTAAEMDAFIEHLKREAKQREAGPS